jgi:hypothetical protein
LCPVRDKKHVVIPATGFHRVQAWASLRLLWILGLAAILVGTAWLVFRPARPLAVIEARRETLTLRAGRLYRQGESTPFSGVVTEVHDNGALRSRSRVADGLLEGVSESWSANGQIQVREHFSARVPTGRVSSGTRTARNSPKPPSSRAASKVCSAAGTKTGRWPKKSP